MKNKFITRAASLSAIAVAFAVAFSLASCDKPAAGLDPLLKADEKTVYDSASSGTSTAATDKKAGPLTAKAEPVVKAPVPEKTTEPVKVTPVPTPAPTPIPADRKSTRLNSSHSQTSYAVFCLKKKKKYL